MPVTFTRVVRSAKRETGQTGRQAMIERRLAIAEKLSHQPAIDLWCTPTRASRPSRHRAEGSTLLEDRTSGKNTVIFRTHRARRGVKLRLTKTDAKKIIAATAKERMQAKEDVASLRKLADAIGLDMVKEIQTKIRAAGLVDTGQLLESIAYAKKNI
jgi:hypothetical protein